MARQIAIGIHSFEKIRMDERFYIDKTDFIQEWWEKGIEKGRIRHYGFVF